MKFYLDELKPFFIALAIALPLLYVLFTYLHKQTIEDRKEQAVKAASSKIYELNGVKAVKCSGKVIRIGSPILHGGIPTHISSFGVNSNKVYVRGGNFALYAESYPLEECDLNVPSFRDALVGILESNGIKTK